MVSCSLPCPSLFFGWKPPPTHPPWQHCVNLIPLVSPVSAADERDSSEALLEDAVKRQGFQGVGLEPHVGLPEPLLGRLHGTHLGRECCRCWGSVGWQRSETRLGRRREGGGMRGCKAQATRRKDAQAVPEVQEEV